MTTVQARRLIDALKGIGMKHGRWKSGGDFYVRTDIRRVRTPSGFTYSEYGEAMAHTNNREASRVIEQHADALALDGHTVTLVYNGGVLTTAFITSRHNPQHVVSEFRDGVWQWRTAR